MPKVYERNNDDDSGVYSNWLASQFGSFLILYSVFILQRFGWAIYSDGAAGVSIGIGERTVVVMGWLARIARPGISSAAFRIPYITEARLLEFNFMIFNFLKICWYLSRALCHSAVD